MFVVDRLGRGGLINADSSKASVAKAQCNRATDPTSVTSNYDGLVLHGVFLAWLFVALVQP